MGKDFFGKYGKVTKVVINKRGSTNRKHYHDISYAAHITYEDEISASLAVIVFGHLCRVCFNSNITRILFEAAMDTLSTARTSTTVEIVIRTIAYIYISSNPIRR